MKERWRKGGEGVRGSEGVERGKEVGVRREMREGGIREGGREGGEGVRGWREGRREREGGR